MTPPVTAIAPLRVVVFDGRPDDAAALACLVARTCASTPLTVEAVSLVTDLSNRLSKGIDLLFMDLGSPESPYDGVDYVRSLVRPVTNTRVIFTGSQQGAHRRVYLVDHLWYLPKPVDDLELHDAMEKALRMIGRDLGRPFAVRAGRTDTVVNPHEVRYVESRLRLLHIHEGDRVVETYGNLGDLVEMLPRSFVRCHKSYLVNLDYARSLGQGYMELTTGEEVPVSQRRHTSVREALLARFARDGLDPAW